MNSHFFVVGAAKAAIPYPQNFFPYRSWGPRYLTGIHDDLCVRVVYIQKPRELLFVCVENGDIDPKWVDKLAKAADVAPHTIFLFATHTHTAPYIGGYWPENVQDVEKSRAYTACAWQTVVNTVQRAKACAQPATVQFGRGECNVSVNRDVVGFDLWSGRTTYIQGQNFHGYSDKTVLTLLFRREDGSPLAVLFNYAVHSSILFHTDQKDGGQMASGDLAGSAMQQTEAALGKGCVALFTMGAAADQDARYTGSYVERDENGQYRHRDFGLGSFALVDSLGRELASEVIALCAKETVSPENSVITTASAVLSIAGKKRNEGPGVPIPRGLDDYEPHGKVPLPVMLARLGDVWMVGIGCEITSHIGAEIRSALARMGHKNVWIITQCNGASSYMADEESYKKVTFKAKASYMMPGASRKLIEGILSLEKKTAES